MRKFISLVAIVFAFASCSTVQQATSGSSETASSTSKEDIVKKVLMTAVGSASSELSTEGGYSNSSIVNIEFPEKAQLIIDNIAKVPVLGDVVIEQFVKSMNSAAEVATEEAYDIFAKSISGMSITDGYQIIAGEDDAATEYLKQNTYDTLREKYKPSITSAMDKTLVGDKSTSELWESIFTSYNQVSSLSFGLIPAQPELDIVDYVLGKAIDGMFVKVAEAEGTIRKDPVTWAKTTGSSLLGSFTK